MGDNYDRFTQHDADEAWHIAALPICDGCGEHIQDEVYHIIMGYNFCNQCLDDCKKVNDEI